MFLRRFTIGALLVSLGSGAWAARKPGDPLKPGFNLFTKADDIQVGQVNSKQVLEQYEVVKNPAVQEYVRRIGQRLAASPEAKQSAFEFTFTVLNVDEINAFALPGGPMFIYTGLLKIVDNEAQVAGVMGHEMSHVILRHGRHEATKANGVQILAGGLASLLGGGKLVEAGLGLTASSFVLKFSRDAESEADALGSHLMAESGYDPIQMAKFFEKLASVPASGHTSEQRVPQILSDHPNPGNREAAIRAEMSTMSVRKYGFETGQFAREKKDVAALPRPVKKPAADAIGPGSGVPSSSAPSDWQPYRGKSFTLSYPAGWQVLGADEVTFAPKDGVVTQGGKTQVGFGAIAGIFAPRKGRADLRAATGDLVAKLRSENPLMTQPAASKEMPVGTANGLLTLLTEDSPFGGQEVDTLYTVVRPEGLFYLIWITPEKDYERLQPSFKRIINSVNFQ